MSLQPPDTNAEPGTEGLQVWFPKLPASLSISLVRVLGQPDAKVSGIPAGLAGIRSDKRLHT